MIDKNNIEKTNSWPFVEAKKILRERKKYIEKAKFELEKKKIKILKSSSFYESFSWPDSKNPKFMNIIIEILPKFPKFSKWSKKRLWTELGGRICFPGIVSVRRIVWRGRQSSYPQIFKNQNFTHHQQPI